MLEALRIALPKQLGHTMFSYGNVKTLSITTLTVIKSVSQLSRQHFTKQPSNQ